jgi:pyrroline-5-carboxylate reductase
MIRAVINPRACAYKQCPACTRHPAGRVQEREQTDNQPTKPKKTKTNNTTRAVQKKDFCWVCVKPQCCFAKWTYWIGVNRERHATTNQCNNYA